MRALLRNSPWNRGRIQREPCGGPRPPNPAAVPARVPCARARAPRAGHATHTLQNVAEQQDTRADALPCVRCAADCALRSCLALFLACAVGFVAVFQARALPRWLGGTLHPDEVVLRLLVAEYVAQSAISAACLADVLVRAAPGRGGVPAAAAAYFWGPHLAMVTKCISLQLPVRLLLLPEAVRATLCLALSCAAVVMYGEMGELTVGVTAALACRAVCAFATSLVAIALCQTRTYQRTHLPAPLGACPAPLLAAVDAIATALDNAAAAALPEAILDHTAVIGFAFGVIVHSAVTGVTEVVAVSNRINVITAIAGAVALVSRRSGGSAASLRTLQRRLGGAEAQAAHAVLCSRLAAAVSEQHVLWVAAEALRELVPGATAQAIATLADEANTHDDDDAGVAVAVMRVDAARDAQRKALHAALPRLIKLSTTDDDEADADASDALPEPEVISSVLLACGQAASRGCIVIDSADWPLGCHSFSDWRAAAAADATIEQCVTAPLMASAGTRAVGFLVLCFRRHGDFAGQAEADGLRRFAEAVGAALQARRAQDATDAATRALSIAAAVAGDAFPEHMRGAMQTRMRRRAASPDGRSVPPLLLPDAGVPPLEHTLMETHPSCTVLFVDVFGFSELSRSCSAEAMLELMDALWLRFDALCEAHGAYKVEAANGRFVAVSGMFPPRPDHARAALRLALDLHAAAAGIGSTGDTPMRLRIGVHCGAITSGVCGSTRARLSIFGAPVSITQQIKRACGVGGIMLSRDAHEACDLPEGTLPRLGSLAEVGALVDCCQLQTDDALLVSRVRQLLDAPPLRKRSETAATDDAHVLLLDIDHGGPAADDEDACASTAEHESPTGRVTSPRTARASAVVAIGRSSVYVRRTSPRSSLLLDGGGATSASSAIADAEAETRAAALLQERSSSHFCGQLFAASGLVLVHVVMSLLHGHPGAAAAAQALLACLVVVITVYARRTHLLPLHSWERICICTFSGTVVLVVWSAMAQMQRRSQLHCAGLLASQCACQYFWLLHAPIMHVVWVNAQLPARLVFFPELLRNAAYISGALFIAHRSGELTPRFAAAVVAEAVVCASITPIWVHLLYAPPATVELLLKEVDFCPPLLRHCRNTSVAIAAALRRRLLRDTVLLDLQGILVLTGVIFICAAAVEFERASVPQGNAVACAVMAVLLSTSVVVRLHPSSALALNQLSKQVEREAQTRVLDALRARLDTGDNEADNLRAGCDALLALFPSATAAALGSFAEGAASDCTAALEVSARELAAHAALEASLPPRVGAAAPPGDGDAGQSSVWRVCGPAGGGGALDSASHFSGLGACTDWRAAVAAGLDTSRAFTLPLQAGPVQVGFLQLHLGLFAAHAQPGHDGVSAHNLALLREVCTAVAAAIFVRRAFAVSRDSFAIGLRAAGVPDAAAAVLQRTISAPGSSSAHGGAADPASAAADAAALAVLDAAAEEDELQLGAWDLDPWALPDAEVCRLFSAMFHSLGLLAAFAISPVAFAAFVAGVAAHYNDNAFRARPPAAVRL